MRSRTLRGIDGAALAHPEPAVAVDLEALLVALVLVPHSYPRNRFFGLYRYPPARRVRRRASMVRSVIADLVRGADHVELQPRGRGARLRYRLIDVGAKRTTLLSEEELALVKLGVERAQRDGELLPTALESVDPAASARLMSVLRRLYDDTLNAAPSSSAAR